MPETFADITPDRLAALSLRRAADAIQDAARDPTVWFFIILDVHRALYCALVAALAGTMSIGAFSDKQQAKWLEYYERSRTDPKAAPPAGNYVLHFVDLLRRAENGTADMMGSPLQLTPDQRADILKLNAFRGDLEHVKPQSWSLAITGLPRMCASAAAAFATLLDSFAHHLECDEFHRLQSAILQLTEQGSENPTTPPASWPRAY